MKFVLPSVRRPSFRRLCLTGYGDLLAQHVLRLPVDFRGIVVGALILAVGVLGWAIGGLWRRAWA